MKAVVDRLNDRRQMNERTAAAHPDFFVRLQAEARAVAYENAARDAADLGYGTLAHFLVRARVIRAMLRVI